MLFYSQKSLFQRDYLNLLFYSTFFYQCVDIARKETDKYKLCVSKIEKRNIILGLTLIKTSLKDCKGKYTETNYHNQNGLAYCENFESLLLKLSMFYV